MGLTQDALSKVVLKKSPSAGALNNVSKSEQSSSSQLPNRVR